MLTQNYNLIGIEDLNVKGMMSNHKLARSVADMGFFEFRRQLEYKSETTGTKVVVADMWFPSTQACSGCGNIKENEERLKLKDREYCCEACGFSCDRDVNAAINLKNYAINHA